MIDTLWQAMGLALLLAVVVGGAISVRRRSGRPLGASEWLAVTVTLLTAGGGAVGAVAWWQDNPAAFAWELPLMASRMLAAAGWAFAVACLLALARPERAAFRLIMAMLLVYLLPLTVAIFLFHLDRFDPAKTITWAFFAIVILLVLGSAAALAASPSLAAPDPRPTGAPLRIGLTLLALIAGAWGLALFVQPAGPWPSIWIWPWDALVSRLIAVMFLTVAVMAAMARARAALARIAVATVVTYGVVVGVAVALNLAAGKPAPLAYLVFWGLAALGLAATAVIRLR